MLRYHSLASLHMFLRLTFLCSAVHQLNLGWYEVMEKRENPEANLRQT